METIDLLRSGQLQGIKRLDLAAGLTQVPTEIFALADSLEILDLSNNCLSSLPDRFAELHQLKIVFFNKNRFETVPEVLSQCPQLTMIGFKSNQIKTISAQALPDRTRWLILTDNQIATLPETMGDLSQLQKLMLAGNRLRSLPETMAACHNLELLRLSANQLSALPRWLLTLPRLAWLAYAGNPCCPDPAIARSPTTAPLRPIDWAELSVGEVLGQGASGVISQGVWHTEPAPQAVAVKIFKGEITSDGFPADEMRACMAAGMHANLVSGLGQVVNHPAGKQGLVLPFIPPHYQTLGGPPSLETCTRDTYAPETQFDLAMVVAIAQGIAAAAAHLHDRGLLHGDLYPHNTLINEAGHSFLGDFGAASFYDRQDTDLGRSLERIEVRAFGCVLDDLLTHCPASQGPNPPAIATRLHQLQLACGHSQPDQRPLFAEICAYLTRI